MSRKTKTPARRQQLPTERQQLPGQRERWKYRILKTAILQSAILLTRHTHIRIPVHDRNTVVKFLDAITGLLSSQRE